MILKFSKNFLGDSITPRRIQFIIDRHIREHPLYTQNETIHFKKQLNQTFETTQLKRRWRILFQVFQKNIFELLR